MTLIYIQLLSTLWLVRRIAARSAKGPITTHRPIIDTGDTNVAKSLNSLVPSALTRVKGDRMSKNTSRISTDRTIPTGLRQLRLLWMRQRRADQSESTSSMQIDRIFYFGSANQMWIQSCKIHIFQLWDTFNKTVLQLCTSTHFLLRYLFLKHIT